MSAPYQPNSLDIFDNSPDDSARKVAETLFASTDLKKIARAVGKDVSTVRAWYKDWIARRSQPQHKEVPYASTGSSPQTPQGSPSCLVP